VRAAFAWLAEWGVSCASLTGGVLTLFVFRRGLPNVAYLVGYLLLLWLVFAVLVELRQPLAESGRRTGRLVVTAADYTIQTLYHGLLLFVLPAYWASATLTSLNVVFLVLLVVLALLATFDPWYRAIVHPRPWLGYVFFVVSIFAALNVALPLVGLPPFGALMASAFVASLAITPVVRRAGGRTWHAALRVTVALGVVAAALAAVGRAWIPPAPLFMARSAILWDVLDLDNVEALPTTISAAEVKERGLVAYTAIYAPAGLRQSVSHVWRHRGRVVETVALAPVLGGRREGYRTYSRKTSFPEESEGRWSVDVVTASGQLIGRLRFRIVR
jgi:Family of unknown function (DUF5924)/Protein of unknown function (DUF2914)